MSIIILEGCDCTGKTTLANALQKITGYEIVKGSSFEIAQLGTEGMYQHMLGLLERNNIIIDRFYLSNYVYGNLYDKPTMSVEQFVELSSVAEERGVLTVYVTAHHDYIVSRMKSRGDDQIRTDEIAKILDMYELGLSRPATAQSMILRVDSTYTDIRKSASTIANFADMTERKIFMNDGI